MDVDESNFRLYRIKVKDAIEGTVCDVDRRSRALDLTAETPFDKNFDEAKVQPEAVVTAVVTNAEDAVRSEEPVQPQVEAQQVANFQIEEQPITDQVIAENESVAVVIPAAPESLIPVVVDQIPVAVVLSEPALTPTF